MRGNTPFLFLQGTECRRRGTASKEEVSTGPELSGCRIQDDSLTANAGGREAGRKLKVFVLGEARLTCLYWYEKSPNLVPELLHRAMDLDLST